MEQKKLLDLDKNFYQYKTDIKAKDAKEKENTEKLIKEKNEQKEELEKTKKNLQETETKLKEAFDVVKNLQNEGERKKAEMEEIKQECHNKIEEIKSFSIYKFFDFIIVPYFYFFLYLFIYNTNRFIFNSIVYYLSFTIIFNIVGTFY